MRLRLANTQLISVCTIAFGLMIASTTELLDDLIDIGVIYVTPIRLYTIILSIIIFFIAAANKFKITLKPHSKSVRMYFLGVFSLLISASVSAVTSDDPISSLKKLLYLLSYYVLIYLTFLALKQSKIDSKSARNILLPTIIVVGIVLSIFAFIQVKSGLLLLWVEERTIFGLTFLRINSLFKDPNFFAFYMMLPLIFITNYFRRMPALALIVWLIFAVVILLTGSRSAIISVFLAYIILWVISLRSVRANLGVIIFALLCAAVFIFAKLDDYSVDAINSIFIEGDVATAGSRLLSWYAGLNLLQSNPFFGVGPGNFVTQNKGDILINLVPHGGTQVYDTLAAHSNYIEFAVELGLVGLALYVFVSVYPLVLLNRDQTNMPISKKYQVAIVSTLIFGATLSYLSFAFAILTGFVVYEIDCWQKSRVNSN